MNISDFVQKESLRPADVIVAQKRDWNVLDHTAVYLGKNKESGRETFAANMMDGGVRVLSNDETQDLLDVYRIDRINRFKKSDSAREMAINRAHEMMGKPYNLIFFNCEHFTNYVQTGEAFSKQVREIGMGALGIAVFAGIIGSLKKGG